MELPKCAAHSVRQAKMKNEHDNAIVGLAEAKAEEAKLIKQKKLKRYNIANGYMYTNNPELFESLKSKL